MQCSSRHSLTDALPARTPTQKKELQYDLLSDPTRELIGQLTGSIASTVRSHFVISDGKLADIQLKVVAKDSAASAVAFIENK